MVLGTGRIRDVGDEKYLKVLHFYELQDSE